MKPLRLTVTGFGPFPGFEQNPSGQIVKHLSNRRSESSCFKIFTHVFPVEYQGAYHRVLAAIQQSNPDIFILLGVYSGNAKVRLEKIARNLNASSKLDNSGICQFDETIVPEGPELFDSTLPLEHFSEKLQQFGLPAMQSLSAGGYLCNNHYYLANYIQKEKKFMYESLLVHVPDLNSTDCGLSLESVADGVLLLAEWIAEELNLHSNATLSNPTTCR